MGRYYNVNLTEHTCDCGRYQETKYPCVHALAAASKFDLPSEIFAGLFSPIYKMENIIRAYENSIVVPPNHMVMPNEVERIEPSLHFEKEFRGPGRPLKNKRIKSAGEIGESQTRAVHDFSSSTQESSTAPANPALTSVGSVRAIQAARAAPPTTLLFFPS